MDLVVSRKILVTEVAPLPAGVPLAAGLGVFGVLVFIFMLEIIKRSVGVMLELVVGVGDRLEEPASRPRVELVQPPNSNKLERTRKTCVLF